MGSVGGGGDEKLGGCSTRLGHCEGVHMGGGVGVGAQKIGGGGGTECEGGGIISGKRLV